MNVAEALRVLWRRKVLFVVTASLVFLVAYGLSSRGEDSYVSTASVGLLPKTDGASVGDIAFYGQVVERLLPTYAQQVDNSTFLNRPAQTLSFEVDGDELASKIFVTPISSAGILQISAKDRSAERAQEMAQTVANSFADLVRSDNVLSARVIQRAQVPDSPVSPSLLLLVVAMLIIALGVAAIATLVFERIFGRVTDIAGLASATGLPVLGAIPFARSLVGRPTGLLLDDREVASVAEALREIRTNLLFYLVDSDPQAGGALVAFTSISPGEGKSFVVSNLGVLCTEVSSSTMIVDADIYRPVQAKTFGVPDQPGLTGLTRRGEVSSCIQTVPGLGLTLIPAGRPVTQRAQEVDIYLRQLPRLRDHADLILVDAPPMRASAEVRMLAVSAGRLVMVVRAGSSTAEQLRSAVDSLKSLGVDVIGTVLVAVRSNSATSDLRYEYSYQAPRRGSSRLLSRFGSSDRRPAQRSAGR